MFIFASGMSERDNKIKIKSQHNYIISNRNHMYITGGTCQSYITAILITLQLFEFFLNTSNKSRIPHIKVIEGLQGKMT